MRNRAPQPTPSPPAPLGSACGSPSKGRLRRAPKGLGGLALALLATAGPAAAALPRFPQPAGGEVIFVADGNIWSTPAAGGTATRLTSAAGQDMFPRVSPDGRWIAYTEASRAGTDIWVIPRAGGAARRLTHHPATEAGTGGRHGPDNMVVTWTPDSKYVVYLTKRDQWNTWIQTLYRAPVEGGPSEPMPLDTSVGLLTYGPDGRTIAYNRIFRNFRTWKRYNGGLAQEVFLYNFDTKALQQITDWSGTNTSPMWWRRKIYFLSDRDQNRRENIWVYDLDTHATRQVTHFTDYDIDFPALGGDAIAFQDGGKLYRLDLPSETMSEVRFTLPDDNPRTRRRVDAVKDEVREVDAAGDADFALAPNGKRALFSARGDIFSVPAEDGPTRNLTATPGADEDHPAWSPDGRMVAYTTDVSGAQEIAVRPAAGGPEKILTDFKTGYFYAPLFSPDGKTLAFSDAEHRLFVTPVAGGSTRLVAQDPQSEIHDAAFSPDSRWLVFSMSATNRRRDLYLYDLTTGRLTRLGEGGEVDANPGFTGDGKYLVFTSNRHENPVPSDAEFDFSLLKSMGVYAAPLTRDAPSPVAPRSDEGDAREDAAAGPKDAGAAPGPRARAGGKGGPSGSEPEPVRIDTDGLMSRAVALPVDGASIAQMDVRGQKIIYLTQPIGRIDGPLDAAEKSALKVFDLKTRKTATVTEDVDAYALSQDGTRVLIRHDKTYTALDVKADAAKDAETKKTLDLDHMRLLIDPPAEWAEMFQNAWRLERDIFFSKVMNGQDWTAVKARYQALLPLLGSREDLNYVIGEMLGEIGNSHTYVGGGDEGDSGPRSKAALLGADYALDAASGRYRFKTIYPGDNTREDYRSPLGQPGLRLKAGDYLLAINGVELKAPAEPDTLLVTADADAPAELEVADAPTGPRRRILVRPVEKEISLREAAWIAHNRAEVNRLSGGRIGYVYMSDMEQLGLQQFVRQFYGQLGKSALIMDDRWNNGGFIAPFALERLRRALVTLETNREGAVSTDPAELVNGPKVALLNHWSASDGDIFPYFFKRYGLGKLVGTRSWGGVRGIRGNINMLDGGYVTVPEDALYTPDRQWAVENHGVDPDVEVENTPASILAGHDAQLEAAVDLLMKEIAGKPSSPPPPPPLLPPYPPAGVVAPAP